MNKYYFTADSSKFEEYSIQPAGWADDSECEEDDTAFEDRDTFEADYYLEHCITQTLGKPPSGSGFKLERIESDYNEYNFSVYERLLYLYRPAREKHINYLKSLVKLLDSKRWNKKCQKEFETAYKKFVEFKKKFPEEDYEF
ncbi:MAG: hypothetical protein ACM3MI_11620 [Clostridiales bacterium]